METDSMNMDMVSEIDSEMMKLVNPVGYWRNRARQALESRSVNLPPSPRRSGRRCSIRRRPLPENKVPPGVANVRQRRDRIGLDLICDTCHQFISKSEVLKILCHFFPPDGADGSPLTRCYVRCPNCCDDIELGRNIGDADNFRVIAGASQYFPAAKLDTVPKTDPNLKNDDAYPDSLLDSPNDGDPRGLEKVVVAEYRLLIIPEAILGSLREAEGDLDPVQ